MSENRKKADDGTAKGGPMAGFGAPVQKAKDVKGTFKRLLTYFKPHTVKFIIVFVFAILSTIFNIVSPKILGNATTKLFEGIYGKLALAKLTAQQAGLEKLAGNQATATPEVLKGLAAVKAGIAEVIEKTGGKIDFPYIEKIILLLIGLYVISSLFSFVQQYIMAGIGQNVVYKMRQDLSDKLNKLPIKFYDSRTNGEILSRVTNDMDNISTTLQQSLTQLITSVVTIIGVLIMMLTISPVLTLVAVVTLPLCGIATSGLAKKSQQYFAGQQKEIGELNGHVEEMYTGHKIVKAFGKEKDSIEKFDKINKRLYDVGWKAQFISGVVMPIMNFINNVGYVVVCVVGGIYVAKKKIEIGDIQAFIQYTRQFTMPIVQTANIVNIVQSTIASAERVFELLDEVDEVAEAAEPKVIEMPKGEVRFEHVDFGYKEGVTLIEDMNVTAKPGQTVAIVGPTGAGKTTLVNLLMRFYEINAGKITIDGVDTRDMTRENLRGMFGMVLQDTWLFNGTIRDNIAYGKEGCTEEEVIQASKAANADHFIRTLPEGYDTVLNEEGTNISQGQKQLLTIARAILADPRILILDEATSSVDTRTEVHIQKAMENLMKGRTSFVIAHRLSTIRDADLILVMNNGSIIEQGNHEELIAKNGFYADLYNSQFSDNDSEVV
ncbi:ABC transporter, ATP-binding/permease protein [Clostridium pasteurianum DSM 525 = ATCC 6013]|uniref:ABC transporter, ATP-binding/permease protein n=1 Tax=Clostridium pasteurianum DSM 525 = ATCC 6013 TaxID=1262449 RepID=A0A0H3J363_CLOPA|nr:ABC transporter ATP-binding protein [Clostridium pasteurianum]AJA47242.1 ABC transporter, ATP-binding/permease protein [Clostridium pasteurianum DSM 525 = ATCC 6013]AJA51230.1 ABC transporter, ATP-binding/permease protein [Clostridium pasteurianum DSM 525 = ATCC 6013]AOZ74593.1 ABC transporter [Clostridium pasteurianum DSM 525 = ATCC 6013]AOZ78390.1 ABC transporter [Clostridium pasteurianum]ELP59374.1 ABC-type multidrug/protein/lipid transport system, ATPase component [Clostridium pasteuria